MNVLEKWLVSTTLNYWSLFCRTELFRWQINGFDDARGVHEFGQEKNRRSDGVGQISDSTVLQSDSRIRKDNITFSFLALPRETFQELWETPIERLLYC